MCRRSNSADNMLNPISIGSASKPKSVRGPSGPSLLASEFLLCPATKHTSPTQVIGLSIAVPPKKVPNPPTDSAPHDMRERLKSEMPPKRQAHDGISSGTVPGKPRDPPTLPPTPNENAQSREPPSLASSATDVIMYDKTSDAC